MVKRIDDLRFRQDEEGQLVSLLVKLTPHYVHALNYYCGRYCRVYHDWQKSRGKDPHIKSEKYHRLLNSLRKKGLKVPILVRGNEIQHGHHRAAGWAALGHEEIECREQ